MDTSKSILQEVFFSPREGTPFSFDVKRDDLIDPLISGNKWRKLKYNILHAKQLNKKGILTFGGAYSNHLIATAKTAKLHQLASIGIVRGEELSIHSNPTLMQCHELGMQLIFITRSAYKASTQEGCYPSYANKYPEYYLIPEGGNNYYGMLGCQEIHKEIPKEYDHIYLAGGTGTTAAGILWGSNENTHIHLISALKGTFLFNNIKKLMITACGDKTIASEYLQRLEVISDKRFGGFAKNNPSLFDEINQLYRQTGLKTEPIYTGKVWFQLFTDVQNELYSKDEKILFIHTGGLQNAASWNDQLEWFNI